MKLSHRFSVYASRLALAGSVAAAMALTACGGGGSDPVTVTPPPVVAPVVTGSASGTLTDAAVGGVSYTTSSGVTGTTTAAGLYTYNPGDTVTFKLGAVTLGSVTATGVLTPMELSGGSAAKLQNLLVLLQSLDSDGNPANGITIPGAAAAALAYSVNLSGSTATFAADAGVQAAMTAGGVGGAPKTVAAASAHFKSQGLELLSRNIWVSQSYTGGTHTTVLRFNADGSYMHAEAGVSDDDGHTGLETGTVTVASFAPTGFSLTSTVAHDSNGDWGASNLQPCDTFRNSGVELVIGDSCTNNNGTGRFKKMDNDPATLVGAWEFKDETRLTTYYFFADGRLLGVQALLVNGVVSDSAVTSARYTPSSGSFVFSPDGGSNSSTVTFTMGADGKTLVFSNSPASTFTRISK